MRSIQALTLIIFLAASPLVTAQDNTFTIGPIAPSISSAQNSAQGAPGFDVVARDLKAGETIVVTDVAGKATRGRVKQASPTTLVIRVHEQERAIDSFDIVRISRPSHSLRNGMLIGLAAGFTFGAVVAASSGCGYTCFARPPGVVIVGGVFGSIGMGVGALISAPFPREHVMFERGEPHHADVRVVPYISRTASGLGLAVVF